MNPTKCRVQVVMTVEQRELLREAANARQQDLSGFIREQAIARLMSRPINLVRCDVCHDQPDPCGLCARNQDLVADIKAELRHLLSRLARIERIAGGRE